MRRTRASVHKRTAARAVAGGVLSPRRTRSGARRGGARAGTVRLFLVFFALIGINIYFLGYRGGTSIGELLRITRVHAGAAAPTASPAERKPVAKVAALVEDPAGGRTIEVELGDGQTIAQALTAQIGSKLAASVQAGFDETLDLASVHAGQALTIVEDADDRPVAVEFRASPVLAHRLELSAKPTTTRIEGKVDSRAVEVVVPCGPGLWEGLKRAGEHAALGELMGRVLGGEGDLATCGAGERLRVIAEKRLVGGRFQRYRRIIGAEWVTRAGIRRTFAFGAPEPTYFNERGESTARRYLASPLRLSRAAGQAKGAPRSTSDGRVVVEYSGPIGSVVQAVATGTVTGITRAAGGISVVLTLAEGGERIEYARLSRLARGTKLGAILAQGRAIGRCDAGVSATYEGTGAAIQLARIPAPRLASLTAAERPHFGEQIAPVLERLRALGVREPQGLAARSVSAIP